MEALLLRTAHPFNPDSVLEVRLYRVGYSAWVVEENDGTGHWKESRFTRKEAAEIAFDAVVDAW